MLQIILDYIRNDPRVNRAEEDREQDWVCIQWREPFGESCYHVRSGDINDWYNDWVNCNERFELLRKDRKRDVNLSAIRAELDKGLENSTVPGVRDLLNS